MRGLRRIVALAGAASLGLVAGVVPVGTAHGDALTGLASGLPSVTHSEAFAEVRVQVDPHAERRLTRQETDFVDFEPAPFERSDSSSSANARSRGTYQANITESPGAVEIVARGHLDTRGRCGGNRCGEPQAEATASLVVDLSATGDIPYTLDATLNASGHAHPCATAEIQLLGDDVAEDLIVSGPNTATDPGCNAALPGHVLVSTDGVVHASGTLRFALDVQLDLIDPGSIRTDVLHADWDLLLTLYPACTVLGTDEGEPIDGTPGDDVLCGLGGADAIEGGGGADLIFGGDGGDTITAGSGEDTVFGGSQVDLIDGGEDGDTVYGGGEDDEIVGGGGSDLLYGDAGSGPEAPDDGRDTIHGGPGPDVILGGGGSDHLFGDEGEDVLSGGTDDDTIDGGTATDFINGGRGNDDLSGNGGVDEIHGDVGDDLIHGGTGNDRLFGEAGSDKLLGQDGNDLLVGGTRKDVLRGGDGNDDLRSRDGIKETVDCGRGASDRFQADVSDIRSGCEFGTSG